MQQLIGYHKRTTLQVFVGWDTGKLGPHMFYQVCRVTGKNSTPCQERQVEGTAVIETVLEPESDMTMRSVCIIIIFMKVRSLGTQGSLQACSWNKFII